MRKKLLSVIAGPLLLSLGGVPYAAQAPRSLPQDERIKMVPFQENNIVPINTSVFINTQIIFNGTETIIDVENGDSSAWTYHINPDVAYILTLKPIIMGSNTDLSVITRDESNRTRIYRFHITSADKVVTDTKQQVYSIQFVYPENEREMLDNTLRKLSTQSSLVTGYSKLNWDYSFNGDQQLMPQQVYDDGRFTYITFPKNQAIPAVFAVDNDEGQEAVVNVRQEGGLLVIQQVAPQFTLRNGATMVASIFNDTLIKKLSS